MTIIFKDLIKDKTFHFLCFTILLSIIILFFLGKFNARFVPDTGGYIIDSYKNFTDLFNNQRAPFFGLFLKFFEFGEKKYFFFPFFSIGLYFFSIIFLYYSQKIYGLSKSTCLSIPLGLIFSNPLLLYSNYIHPEILSISLIIITFSLEELKRILVQCH